MDLLQIKYFQTVARLEHMTRAAGELQVAQPALSATIAKLEHDLGVPLFNRTGRNIVLNEYGKSFLKRANRILRELEEGRQEISDLLGSESGYISFSSTSLNKQFADFIGTFASLYPKVNFHITQIADEDVKLRLLESEEIDFAFVNTILKHPGISTISLAEENIFLAVSSKHPLAGRNAIFLKELMHEPFVSMKTNHGLQKFCDELCQKNGFTPKIICECSESSAVINLVAAGLGVSFFPYSDSEKTELPVVLLRIKDLDFKNVLQLAWKKKRCFSKAAIHFREYVIQSFA